MPLWYSWSAFEGDTPAFSRLQELCLLSCPKLCPILPFDIPSITRLSIEDCGIADSLHLPISVDTLELASNHGTHMSLSALCRVTHLRALRIGRSERRCATSFVKDEPILISPSVQELEISNCIFKSICRLPPWLRLLDIYKGENVELEEQSYECLQYLCVSRAYSIKSFCFDQFPKLISLDISQCFKLRSFMVPAEYILESLYDLSISNCSSLLEFPPGGLLAPNLTFFSIQGCNRLMSLPERMHCSMPSLKSLYIKDCPEIGLFPIGGLPYNLHTLKIHGCYKLMPVHEDWLHSQVLSLVTLEVGGSMYHSTYESFPNSETLLPTSITSLSIRDFRSIKFLNAKAFQHLTSLQELKISDCPQLKCLPEDGLPKSLCSLQIYACPLLQLRCQKTGEDWPKISHLPHICIHSEEI